MLKENFQVTKILKLMLSKRKKESLGKYDVDKLHSIDDACGILKKINS